MNNLTDFIKYCNKHINGDEKGEAQIFLDHFFMALGYPDGIKGAGADLEYRIRNEKGKSTNFADLFWPKRVLIEMKKAGEDLSKHLQQVTSYWLKLAGKRPQFVILCNFKEFWIYDFEKDVYEPAEKVKLENLAKRSAPFAFLLPKPKTPVFELNREKITRNAAVLIDSIFKSMVSRGLNREHAIKFCMQCVLAMFAEDVNLLPDDIFSRIIKECVHDVKGKDGGEKSEISFDLIGNLFKAMNEAGITAGGKYKGVDYFDGGLFKEIVPLELTVQELNYLDFACQKDWSSVNPAIFGSIFEGSMEKDEQHILGAHYTYEIDIKKIVDPVIVQPWKEKINQAENSENPLDQYYKLLNELREFKVLDAACGSGNFLFVAYREIKMLEKQLLSLIRENSPKREHAERLKKFLTDNRFVSTRQFLGIDKKPFAVELAKMTMMLAKELWVTQNAEDFDNENALPLENLDKNIIAADALLNEDGLPRQWPEADAIIGNPPYQSKNKMQKEFGVEYVNKLRNAYPEIPGRADFCVYWFYKAHEHLKPNCYAGLVGTNTIRQNYSREGSLDYIVKNGGQIINAISSQKWSGEAVVFVSIVNWIKGNFNSEKYLFTEKQNQIEIHILDKISSSLSLSVDLTQAKVLKINNQRKLVFQGQTHGYDGFLIPNSKAFSLIRKNSKNKNYLFPYLNGEELVGKIFSQPQRHSIDFSFVDDINEVAHYSDLFDILKNKVFPKIKEKANLEKEGKIKKNGRQQHLNYWWRFWRRREDMLKAIMNNSRYIACSRVSARPFFEFISKSIHPNDALMVFVFEDDYSFGIIESILHIKWYSEKCSTLKGDARYTATSIWNTFPWPQNPTLQQIKKVAEAAKTLRDARNENIEKYKMTLRDIYRQMELPGKNPIKELHKKLNEAVMEAYGFDKTKDILQQLLDLNFEVANKEHNGENVQAPGLPDWVTTKDEFISDDCVKFIESI